MRLLQSMGKDKLYHFGICAVGGPSHWFAVLGGGGSDIIDISVNFVYNDTKGDFVWLDINTARIPRK